MISKNKSKLKTPVLYLVFNRPDLVERTFQSIKKARPEKLYLAADGPRNGEEKVKTEKVRKYILNNIDWECKVNTLFRDKNLGCENAVSGAINWFFDNVEKGIIIEDDCLVSDSFFRYCEELLEKYKKNPKVMSIFALSPTYMSKRKSYDFAKITGLWGWASWRDIWKSIYEKERRYMKNKNPKEYLKEVFPNFIERLLFKKRFKDYSKGKVSTWEHAWVFGIIRSKGVNIMPRINMIKNLGIGEEYTNTKPNFIDKLFLDKDKKEMEFPLKHPRKVKLNNLLRWRLVARDITRVILKKILFL